LRLRVLRPDEVLSDKLRLLMQVLSLEALRKLENIEAP
jgi:hypothetical protein